MLNRTGYHAVSSPSSRFFEGLDLGPFIREACRRGAFKDSQDASQHVGAGAIGALQPRAIIGLRKHDCWNTAYLSCDSLYPGYIGDGVRVPRT